jgi:hypothetical protein
LAVSDESIVVVQEIVPDAAAPARTRTVVSDDGVQIRLMIYADGIADPLAVSALSAREAVWVVAELAAAAARHLARMRDHSIGVRRGL